MLNRPLASMMGFLVLAALGLAPTQAAAQTTTTGTITINTGTQATELVDANHNPVSHSYQPATSQLFWVNLSECRLGWQYQVSVTTAGIGSATMEVWAGLGSADCSQTTYRYGTGVYGTQQCWRVASVGIIDQTSAVYIPVENVVAQIWTSDTNGADVPTATAADCDRIAASGTIPEAGESVNLNFYVFLAGTSGTPTYSATWSGAGFDLIGPQAPTGVSLQPADTEMYVNWGQVVVTDLAGYNIFCQDLTANDGGLSFLGSNDAGLTDAGTVACPAKNTPITAGCLPPDGMSPSGTVASTLATSGIAGNLKNGDTYACAVSCYDTMQNNGPLSEYATSAPWYVDDFFSNYRERGGKAGGGFCSVGKGRSAFALVIPLAAIVLLALRRRRSRS
jgi:hypothetical protein